MPLDADALAQDSLFCEIAVRKMYITREEGESALRKQRVLLGHGLQKRLGAILIEEGLLDGEQVKEILSIQHKAILHCPKCSSVFNVEGFEPGKRFLCKKCRSVLQVPAANAGGVEVEETIVAGEGRTPSPPPPAPSPTPSPTPPAAASTTSGMLGRELGGCRIEAMVGRGGMGAVYRALQLSLNRPVALKVLPEQVSDDETYIARFEREARTVATLSHPNIVQVYDMGKDPTGLYYIVMEFLEGGSLGCCRKKPFAEADALRHIAEAAEGLFAAHREGILHRDIKPDNLMLDRYGFVKVADFGLARATEASVDLTGSGAAIGTPAFMSPEQGMGEVVDSRSDLYSLGATLFALIAGQNPYQAESPISMIVKHAREPVPRLRRAAPHASKAAEDLVCRAMAKKPKDRFQTGEEFAKAAREALASLGGESDAPRERTPSPSAKRAERAHAAAAEERPKPKTGRQPAAGAGGRGPAGGRAWMYGGGAALVLALLVAVIVAAAGSGGKGREEAPPQKKERRETAKPADCDGAWQLAWNGRWREALESVEEIARSSAGETKEEATREKGKMLSELRDKWPSLEKNARELCGGTPLEREKGVSLADDLTALAALVGKSTQDLAALADDARMNLAADKANAEKAMAAFRDGTVYGDLVVPRGRYRIGKDLEVPAGSSITFEAGARIAFAADAGIHANGTITAKGTKDRGVEFEPEDMNAGFRNICLDGIGSGNSEMSFASIKGGKGRVCPGANYQAGSKSYSGVISGGAILLMNRSKITLGNCSFSENFAQLGGAIFAYQSDLVMENCRLDYNKASAAAGGICASGSNCIRIISTSITNSMAENDSAGIKISSCRNVYLNKVTIEKCLSNANGGALEILASQEVFLEGIELLYNTAKSDKGGLDIRTSSVKLSASTFKGNKAEMGSTGACAIYDSNVEALDCTFEFNHSRRGAGAVHALGEKGKRYAVLFKKCTFRSNSTDASGGAAHLEKLAGDVRFEHCLFQGNTAAEEGGALCVRTSAALLTSCRFLENASVSGGALSVSGASAVEIRDAQVLKNTARKNQGNNEDLYNGGAGILLAGSCKVKIAGSRIEGNVSEDGGGGMYVRGTVDEDKVEACPDLVLVDCSIKDNSAAAGGAGARISQARISATKTTVSGNKAASAGGGFEILSGPVLTAATLDDCTFEGNESKERGGALSAAALPDAADKGFEIRISNGKYVNNRSDEGGAVHAQGRNSRLTSSDATFLENRARANGGAFHLSRGLAAALQRNKITRNGAVRGAGICSLRCALELSDNEIAENNSTESGGGVSWGGRRPDWKGKNRLEGNLPDDVAETDAPGDDGMEGAEGQPERREPVLDAWIDMLGIENEFKKFWTAFGDCSWAWQKAENAVMLSGGKGGFFKTEFKTSTQNVKIGLELDMVFEGSFLLHLVGRNNSILRTVKYEKGSKGLKDRSSVSVPEITGFMIEFPFKSKVKITRFRIQISKS